MDAAQREHVTQQLSRQGFGGAGDDLVSAVEHAGGLNAQTPHGPVVGLWSRTGGLDLDAYARLLQSYALVKANLFRGTVFLVTARQYVAWRGALQPALLKTVKQFCPGLHERVDLDAVVAAGTDLLGSADGLSRKEIGTALAPGFPGAAAEELGFAVRLLAPVVQVADRDVWRPQRTRYILASRALSPAVADAGLHDLLRSYLGSLGPATAADASYFTGLTGLGAPLRDTASVVPGSPPRAPRFDIDSPHRTPAPDAVVLAEYENVYFAAQNGPLQPARTRLIPNPATRMHGSLLWRGEPVAAWHPDGDGLALEPWGPLPAAVRRAFAALEAFHTDAARKHP